MPCCPATQHARCDFRFFVRRICAKTKRALCCSWCAGRPHYRRLRSLHRRPPHRRPRYCSPRPLLRLHYLRRPPHLLPIAIFPGAAATDASTTGDPATGVRSLSAPPPPATPPTGASATEAFTTGDPARRRLLHRHPRAVHRRPQHRRVRGPHGRLCHRRTSHHRSRLRRSRNRRPSLRRRRHRSARNRRARHRRRRHRRLRHWALRSFGLGNGLGRAVSAQFCHLCAF